jgi:hypothetical protein
MPNKNSKTSMPKKETMKIENVGQTETHLVLVEKKNKFVL